VFLGINFDDERAFYYFTLVILAAVILAVIGVRRSRTARALIAARDNEAVAQSVGINLVRARLTAFALSGFLASFAGALFAFSQRGVDQASFDPTSSINVFLATVIGGFGSVAGPIVGALYVGILRLSNTTPFAALINIVANPGLGVIALFLVMPGGLVQGVYGLRDAWLRRLASRYRIIVPSLVADRSHSVLDGVQPMLPKLRPGGGTAFVPARYRLPGQWQVAAMVDARRGEEVRADA
jgi:branched-chain amino acid transport system permease protein